MSPPMLLIVDDDPAILSAVSTALAQLGEVRPFSDARLALAALEHAVPDAIVSDIVMPSMGGFEFRRLYAARFGARRTPFLFLSSLADPETMVAGLEAGGDDYLVKPVVPELLRARVRALLRRGAASPSPSFRGDFSRLSFVALLGLCEEKRFSGQLVVEAGELRITLPLRGGELDATTAAPYLDRLCELAAGRFERQPSVVEFDELVPPSAAPTAPAGRLSALTVRGRRLEIQTELVAGETPTVVSVVLAEGQPVGKLRRAVPRDADVAAIHASIDALHAEAEASTHDRISAIRHRKQHGPPGDAPSERAVEGPAIAAESAPPRADSAPPRADEPRAPEREEPPQTAGALFDEGFDLSRRGEWARALACWERALELEPDNRTLLVNIEVARKKIAASRGAP